MATRNLKADCPVSISDDESRSASRLPEEHLRLFLKSIPTTNLREKAKKNKTKDRSSYGHHYGVILA